MRPVAFAYQPSGDDSKFDALQRLVQNALVAFAGVPLLEGRLIESVTLTSGVARDVAHGLPHAHRGWWVISPNAAAHVYETLTSTELADSHVRVTSTATVTCDLWVF